MTNLSFDVHSTKALLIGISDYEYFPEIQPAENNISDIIALLTDKNIIGLPVQNIISIINKSHSEIADTINIFLSDPENINTETLIFYYVGHGYREVKTKELYLTGTNSKKTIIKFTAIPFSDIKDQIESSQIQNRIIIIDACHSGLATMDSDGTSFTDSELDIKGTYIITSTAGDEKSLFDADKRNTFFSEELINIMKNGTLLHNQFISLENLYSELQKNLKQSKLPDPQRRTNLNASNFYFFKNKKFDLQALLEQEGDVLYQNLEFENAKIKYAEAFFHRQSKQLKLKIKDCENSIELINKSRTQEELKRKLAEEKNRNAVEEELQKVEEEKRKLLEINSQKELDNTARIIADQKMRKEEEDKQAEKIKHLASIQDNLKQESKSDPNEKGQSVQNGIISNELIRQADALFSANQFRMAKSKYIEALRDAGFNQERLSVYTKKQISLCERQLVKRKYRTTIIIIILVVISAFIIDFVNRNNKSDTSVYNQTQPENIIQNQAGTQGVITDNNNSNIDKEPLDAEAYKKVHDQATAYINSARTKYSRNDFRGAIEDYSTAIQLDPEYSIAYRLRGNVKYDLWDFRGALGDYTIALQLDPKNVDYLFLFNFGVCYQLNEEYANAIKMYTKALEFSPNSLILYSNLGYCFMDLNDFTKAIQHFAYCFERDNNNVGAIIGLALVYYYTGNYDMSTYYINLAKYIEPDLREGYYGLEKFKKKGYFFNLKDENTLKMILSGS